MKFEGFSKVYQEEHDDSTGVGGVVDSVNGSNNKYLKQEFMSQEDYEEKNKVFEFTSALKELNEAIDSELGEITADNSSERVSSLKKIYTKFKENTEEFADVIEANEDKYADVLKEQMTVINEKIKEYKKFEIDYNENIEKNKKPLYNNGGQVDDSIEKSEESANTKENIEKDYELIDSLEELENNIDTIGEITRDNHAEKIVNLNDVGKKYKEIKDRFGDVLEVDKTAGYALTSLERKIKEKQKEFLEAEGEVMPHGIINSIETIKRNIADIGEIDRDNYREKYSLVKSINEQYKESVNEFRDILISNEKLRSKLIDQKRELEAKNKELSNTMKEVKNFGLINSLEKPEKDMDNIGTINEYDYLDKSKHLKNVKDRDESIKDNLDKLEKNIYNIGEITRDNYIEKSEALNQIIKQYRGIVKKSENEIKSDKKYLETFLNSKDKVEALFGDYLDAKEQKDEIREDMMYRFSIDGITLGDELSKKEIYDLKEERKILEKIIESKLDSFNQELNFTTSEEEKNEIKEKYVRNRDDLKNKLQKIDKILGDEKENVELEENTQEKQVNNKELIEKTSAKIEDYSEKEFYDNFSEEEQEKLRKSEKLLTEAREEFVQKKMQLEKTVSRLGSLFEANSSNQLVAEFEEYEDCYKKAQETYIKDSIALKEKEGKIDSAVAIAISRRVKIGEFSKVVREECKNKYHERNEVFSKFLNGRLAKELSLKIGEITNKLFRKKIEDKEGKVNSEMSAIEQQIDENSYDGKIDSKDIKDILSGEFTNKDVEKINELDDGIDDKAGDVLGGMKSNADIAQEKMFEFAKKRMVDFEKHKYGFDNALNLIIGDDREKLNNAQVIDIENGKVELANDKVKEFQELKILIGGVLHEESNSKDETLKEYSKRVVREMYGKCVENKNCNDTEIENFNKIFNL